MYIPRPIRVRPREENILNTKKLQMENIMGFTEYTRQWLIALGIVQDLRSYCRNAMDKARDNGVLLHDYDNELLKHIKGLNEVIHKNLADQINASILEVGEANVSTGEL